jgi:hypothetical protein
VFPADVIARAKELQEEIGSIGAYSHSQGVPFIRKSVARFIEGEFRFVSFRFVRWYLLSSFVLFGRGGHFISWGEARAGGFGDAG